MDYLRNGEPPKPQTLNPANPTSAYGNPNFKNMLEKPQQQLLSHVDGVPRDSNGTYNIPYGDKIRDPLIFQVIYGIFLIGVSG